MENLEPREDVGGDDALLTAWLDGELAADERAALDRRLAAEPALRERLDVLRGGGRPFAEAYDALLAEAPEARLKAGFAALAARAESAPGRGRRWPQLAAAALLVFVLGGIAGYLVSVLTTPAPPTGWRQAVAEYHAFISPETVAFMAEDDRALAAELAAIGVRMNLDLAPERLALAGAELKRAQLYDYNGMPLLQLVYQDADAEPFALCIIANGRPDGAMDFEEREGSGIVYWYKDGYGYLVIGRETPRAALEAWAGDIASRFS